MARQGSGMERARPGRLGGKADRAEMKGLGGAQCGLIDSVGGHQHVGAGAAIEQEITLAIGERLEGKARSALLR